MAICIFIYIYIFYTNTVICLCQTLSLAATSHTDNGIGSDWPAQNRRDVFYSLFNRRCRREEKKKEKKRTIVCGFCGVWLLCARVRLCLYTRFYTVQSLTTRSMALYKYLPIYLSIHLSINQLIPCRNTSSNCLTCFGQSLPQPLHLTAAPSASR